MVIEPDDIVFVPKAQILPNLLRDLSSPSTIDLCDDSLLPIQATLEAFMKTDSRPIFFQNVALINGIKMQPNLLALLAVEM